MLILAQQFSSYFDASSGCNRIIIKYFNIQLSVGQTNTHDIRYRSLHKRLSTRTAAGWQNPENLVSSLPLPSFRPLWYFRAGSRFAPSQWETVLLCHDVSHWLGTHLESALQFMLFVPSILPFSRFMHLTVLCPPPLALKLCYINSRCWYHINRWYCFSLLSFLLLMLVLRVT